MLSGTEAVRVAKVLVVGGAGQRRPRSARGTVRRRHESVIAAAEARRVAVRECVARRHKAGVAGLPVRGISVELQNNKRSDHRKKNSRKEGYR